LPTPHPDRDTKIVEACPHCGEKLSPWQQVLLSVDRALTCKHCWYRIIVDVFDPDERAKKTGSKQP
jgi:DNA-directed RNA polymerase subunit RPC12/RpoP